MVAIKETPVHQLVVIVFVGTVISTFLIISSVLDD